MRYASVYFYSIVKYDFLLWYGFLPPLLEECMPLSKDSQMTILLLHLPKTFLGRVWERSGSGSARHFGTGKAGAEPNGHFTGAAPRHP